MFVYIYIYTCCWLKLAVTLGTLKVCRPFRQGDQQQAGKDCVGGVESVRNV